MKKSLRLWQIIGFIFTGIAGVILHFAYDLSNQSIILAPVSAVNESIWEHMKLLFFPMFIYAIIESRILGKRYDDFWQVKLLGTVIGVILIPVLYYTYTGILGVSKDWFNITIFFIASAVTYWIETILLNEQMPLRLSSKAAIVIFCIIAVIFVVLTFIPPHIPFFEDPVTGSYGINK